LNTIALTELSSQTDQLRKELELPPSGIGFFPERVYVQTGQPVTLTLRVKMGENARAGTTVNVISNSPEVIVENSQAVIHPHKNDPTIGQARIKVEGRQVGGEGTVTAYVGKLRAQAQVQVHSKKEKMIAAPSKGSHALFTDIRFDDRMDPRQRVYFDRVNSSIVVASAAPSVKRYLDQQDRLDTTLHGQVLLAELITEAVCREIARSGVERGKFLAPDGAEADAIQSHFIRLQNRYAHLIHEAIVTLE
jgi:hypothetical protein